MDASPRLTPDHWPFMRTEKCLRLREEKVKISLYMKKKSKRKIREGEGARERNIGRVLVMRVRRYVRVNI